MYENRYESSDIIFYIDIKTECEFSRQVVTFIVTRNLGKFMRREKMILECKSEQR